MSWLHLVGWRKVGITFGIGLFIVIPFVLGHPLSDAACYALAGLATAAIGGNTVSKFARNGNGNGGTNAGPG